MMTSYYQLKFPLTDAYFNGKVMLKKCIRMPSVQESFHALKKLIKG